MKLAVSNLNQGLKESRGLELMRCFDTAAEEIITSQRMSDYTYIKTFIYLVTRNLAEATAVISVSRNIRGVWYPGTPRASL